MNAAVTAASRRLLKISACVRATCSAATAPEASFAESCSAWVQNPMRGSASRIFCQPAVMVTVSSHTSGIAVAIAKRGRRDFTRIVVPSASAVVASSWFAMPKSGQSELMPPKGSTTP